MNIVTVNVFRRPLHTRLCLEAIARAQRWSHSWADIIAVCFACNGSEHPAVRDEVLRVADRNLDINFQLWCAGADVPSTPHAMSKWMLDEAFGHGADIALYVEDDAVLSPDALLMCEWTRQQATVWGGEPPHSAFAINGHRVLGCCLYHETIPEQYVAEGRPEGPDPRLLHLSNGLNTCGGTAFLREPYMRLLSPEWNCKQVEPRGFDYSAHYLMYRHGLYMVWPDLSRSVNLGFESGSLSHEMWRQYFGRSLYTQTKDALEGWQLFRFDGIIPPLVKEAWMEAELAHKRIA